jgi:hypothetical protein
MCEIAKNSVLQSGWEASIKRRWLGDNYHIGGPDGNDINKTNVPNIRAAYRYQTLMEERLMVMQSLRKLSSDCDIAVETSTTSVLKAPLSPSKLSLPAEPLLEPLIRKSPNMFPIPLQEDLSTHLGNLNLQSHSIIDEAALGLAASGYPKGYFLAERIARDRQYSSLLDEKSINSDFDADDMWD